MFGGTARYCGNTNNSPETETDIWIEQNFFLGNASLFERSCMMRKKKSLEKQHPWKIQSAQESDQNSV